MPKKQTLEEFIKKSNIAHNFKYNYDKSIYINKQTKVIVICPEHGDFEVTPGAHYILKSGCPECAKISRSKTKSKGLEKFIKQANLKWNSFYNYSKVNYINNYTKVEIICPIHGSDPDNYNEYIFDPVNKQFELVGQSAIDTTNFAKLSTSNIFLATNTFNEIVTFKKGLKVSESGPVITSNDTTLNLPNTSTPLLKAQSLILNGVSTFNNEIRVSTIAGLTQAPIKVTSAANFNKPIKFNDTIRIETGKIDPGGRGVTWTLGSLIETPTTADNNHHRLCATTDSSNIGYIIYHDRVINGVWKKDKIIPANLWDFTWHDEASIKVKNPTKAEYAANKNYVDTQISTISQFDSSSDQTISGTWEFSKPLKITEAQLADEAVSKGYVDETIQQNLNTTLEGVIKFVSMTEAEYKALETKSPSTIYHLTDVSMWAIGDQEIVTSNMPV